eukprot:6196462-Pleurochrysis_carterae.AAC.3
MRSRAHRVQVVAADLVEVNLLLLLLLLRQLLVPAAPAAAAKRAAHQVLKINPAAATLELEELGAHVRRAEGSEQQQRRRRAAG